MAVERRIEAALERPPALDAQLVLLTIHAKIIQPSVVHQFRPRERQRIEGARTTGDRGARNGLTKINIGFIAHG